LNETPPLPLVCEGVVVVVIVLPRRLVRRKKFMVWFMTWWGDTSVRGSPVTSVTRDTSVRGPTPDVSGPTPDVSVTRDTSVRGARLVGDASLVAVGAALLASDATTLDQYQPAILHQSG
jgi:hypothetical protein